MSDKTKNVDRGTPSERAFDRSEILRHLEVCLADLDKLGEGVASAHLAMAIDVLKLK